MKYLNYLFFIIIILTLLTNLIRKKFALPKSCSNCGLTYCRLCLTGKEKKSFVFLYNALKKSKNNLFSLFVVTIIGLL